MAETAVDFLLESLKQIRKGETDCPFSAVEMNRIGCLSEEVESLKASLMELEKIHTEHEGVKHLLTEIRDVAYEAADIIDLSLVDHISKKKRSWAHKIGHVHVVDSHGKLSDVLKEIKFREKGLMEICEKKLYDPHVGSSSGASASNVGFDQIVEDQLARLEREREIADTAVDFLLENLNQLIKGEIDCPFPLAEMNQVARLYEELQPVGTYFTDSEKNPDVLQDVGDEVAVIRQIACEAADIIDVSLVNKISQKRNLTEKIGHRKLSDVLKHIKSIKKQVMVIYDQKLYGIGDPQVGLSFGGSSSRVSAPNVEEEIVVGFDHQVEMLKERLTGIQNQLEVVSIVGMAGLGKTTLATKLYNDPYILYHFHIRGWTSVSQVYRKRDLLLGILTSVFVHKDEIYTVSDEKLGENLYKRLKGKRYLLG